jgi:hypothetical protein
LKDNIKMDLRVKMFWGWKLDAVVQDLALWLEFVS